MAKAIALTVVLGATALAGCTQGINPTDIDRGVLGAAGAATVAHVAGRKESDVYKAAAIGAAGGALCDDVRLCE